MIRLLDKLLLLGSIHRLVDILFGLLISVYFALGLGLGLVTDRPTTDFNYKMSRTARRKVSLIEFLL